MYIFSIFIFIHIRSSFPNNPILFNLTNNTAIDLGSYTCNQPIDSPYRCEAITDYGGFIYDSDMHQMLLFGGGHSTTFRTDVDVFSFETLKWKSAYDSTLCSEMILSNIDQEKNAWISTNHPISTHTYDALVYTPDTKEFLHLRPGGGSSSHCGQAMDWYPAGKVAHYSPASKTWSYGADRTFDGYNSYEYDPISAKVVSLGRYGLWIYDHVNKIIVKHQGQYNDITLGYANQLVYYPVNQKMYYFNRNDKEVYEVSLNRTDFKSTVIERVEYKGNYPPHGEPGYAYDKVNKVIGGAPTDNRFYAFDPLSKEWSVSDILGDDGGSVAFHAIDYDVVNNVYIWITTDRRTIAYRYKYGIIEGNKQNGGIITITIVTSVLCGICLSIIFFFTVFIIVYLSRKDSKGIELKNEE